jgi:hypothetical protein
METRMFDRPVTVQSTDGEYVETFDRGERVKNVMRIGRRVRFEPVSTHRIQDLCDGLERVRDGHDRSA